MSFNDNRVRCFLATWENVFILLEKHYEDCWVKMKSFSKDLTSKSFLEIQSEFSDFDIREVDLAGRSHPHFQTTERFLQHEKVSVGLVRAYLYHEIGLSILYRGDGLTMTTDGEIGIKEYLTVNRPLSTFELVHIIPMNLKLEDVPDK